jgi:hypothetical protein
MQLNANAMMSDRLMRINALRKEQHSILQSAAARYSLVLPMCVITHTMSALYFAKHILHGDAIKVYTL